MSDTRLSLPEFEKAAAEVSDGESFGLLGALARRRDTDAALMSTLAQHSQEAATADTLAGLLDHHARFDLVLLTRDWLAVVDEAVATDAVVRLRDLHARSVLAVHDQRSPLSPERWRALGYVPRSAHDDVTLYGFNLYDYKQRPDWLNAKYWANPELWDRYRW